jgi:hypothetical protein
LAWVGQLHRHHNIADHDKREAPTRLFENHEEAITIPRCGTEKRQSPIARTGDKVQIVRAIGTMQAAGLRQHRTRSCKKRKDGAPSVSKWEEKQIWKVGPPVPSHENAARSDQRQRRMCRSLMPMISAAWYHVIFFAIARNITSRTFIARSVAALV